jgi:hypothetical protein
MDILDPEQGSEILAALTDMSRRQHIRWRLESGHHGYIADLPRFRLRIYSEDGDDAHPFVLSLLRTTEPDAVEVELIATEADSFLNKGLQDLYLTAKRQAIGADKVVGELMEDLRALDDPF